MVGTTLQRAERFPTAVVADAKQSWLNGQRVSSATTAGQACLLGASVSTAAGPADWKDADGVFAEAAHAVDPDDAPQSVHTDGWQPTPGAWNTLCDNVTLILCVLQAFLTIRDRTTPACGEVGQAVHQRVWDAYHAPRKRAVSQRVRRLQAWAEQALPDSAMQSHTLDVCHKRAQCMPSSDHGAPLRLLCHAKYPSH